MMDNCLLTACIKIDNWHSRLRILTQGFFVAGFCVLIGWLYSGFNLSLPNCEYPPSVMDQSVVCGAVFFPGWLIPVYLYKRKLPL